MNLKALPLPTYNLHEVAIAPGSDAELLSYSTGTYPIVRALSLSEYTGAYTSQRTSIIQLINQSIKGSINQYVYFPIPNIIQNIVETNSIKC